MVCFIEAEEFVNEYITLESLIGLAGSSGDCEWINAIQEEIDPILDLKVGERFTMLFNRDNQDSLGSIKRIK